jgi:hypothetical protein
MSRIRITGSDVRPGSDFQFTAKPDNNADSTFAAILPDEVRVTRRATDLFEPARRNSGAGALARLLAQHGLATTAGELKAKAEVGTVRPHSNPITYFD